MEESELLDDLRHKFPSCELVAFIDLSSDMVLAKSAEKIMLQERWDILCAMAREGMTSTGVDNQWRYGTMLFAALLNKDECDIFLRSETLPDYVICAVGEPDIPVAQFYAAAQPVLDQLVRDD